LTFDSSFQNLETLKINRKYCKLDRAVPTVDAPLSWNPF